MVSTYLETHIINPLQQSHWAKPPYFSRAPLDHTSTPYLYGTVTVTESPIGITMIPLQGHLLRQIANASSARLIDGTVLAFGAGTVTGQTGRYVYRWNMTSVVNNNWPTGITWKVPLPTPLTGAYPSTLCSITRCIYGCDRHEKPVLGL